MVRPQTRHAKTRANEGIVAHPIRRMSRVDQHEVRTEPTRYRESRTVEPELVRARETDTWPGKA